MTARYSQELFSSAHTVNGSEIGTIQTTNKQEESNTSWSIFRLPVSDQTDISLENELCVVELSSGFSESKPLIIKQYVPDSMLMSAV